MINAVIFDIDNTLLDFTKMKNYSINAAVRGMIEAGMKLNPEKAYTEIFEIYDSKGYEYQEVFDDFITTKLGQINYKFLASAIVSYRKAREASLVLYPNVNRTLISLSKMGLKLGVVSDAPSREAWMRICFLRMHHVFDAVVTFDDTHERKPSSKPFKLISRLLEIPAENSIMVGDWPERDVIGAKEVGMKTAFAKYGDTFGTQHSGADYDLNDVSELLDIIQAENNT
ncbi:MAG: HAD-IA family hydrolase [Candidatus Marinimicrobia bacterium]|nr:HAD-IA family hydrolase [Candidatus Neomarinimicrobiota bacterium]